VQDHLAHKPSQETQRLIVVSRLTRMLIADLSSDQEKAEIHRASTNGGESAAAGLPHNIGSGMAIRSLTTCEGA
jgi:hypothetical protein